MSRSVGEFTLVGHLGEGSFATVRDARFVVKVCVLPKSRRERVESFAMEVYTATVFH